MAQNAPGGPGVQAGGGLVGDEQLGVLHRGGGDEHPPGHAAGELKGVELFRLRPQAVPGQDAPALLPGGGVPPPTAHLGAHRHQGVQVGDPLGDQDDLTAPEGLRPFLGEGFPTVEDGPLHGAVVGENAQNPVGQQALARAAGAHHRHHLAGSNGEGQVVDDREVLFFCAPAVLGEGEGQMGYL